MFRRLDSPQTPAGAPVAEPPPATEADAAVAEPPPEPVSAETPVEPVAAAPVEPVVAETPPDPVVAETPVEPDARAPDPKPQEPPHPRRSGWWQRARASIVGE